MNKKIKSLLIILLIIIVIWGLLLFIDYTRYINEQKPIFIFESTHYDYDDGYVNQYNGLGYIFFEYRRENINGNSFVPFWTKMKE